MNGPEHYREAERLLAFANTVDTLEQRQAVQLRAEVHAMLALVAVHAETTVAVVQEHMDYKRLADQWNAALKGDK